MIARLGTTAALLATACGGIETPATPSSRAPLEVAANPPGFTFKGAATVELTASRPARIYFTLGGEHPIGPRALLYEAPIRLETTTLVSFIAASDDGIWSPPETELYVPAPDEGVPELAARALRIDRNNYFFSPNPGQVDRLEARITARSIGLDRVSVSNVYVGVNPKGWGFYEEGVFRLESEFEPIDLSPGQSLEIVVTYAPTVTLRSAMLVVESDAETSEGYQVVELWGRVISW